MTIGAQLKEREAALKREREQANEDAAAKFLEQVRAELIATGGGNGEIPFREFFIPRVYSTSKQGTTFRFWVDDEELAIYYTKHDYIKLEALSNPLYRFITSEIVDQLQVVSPVNNMIGVIGSTWIIKPKAMEETEVPKKKKRGFFDSWW